MFGQIHQAISRMAVHFPQANTVVENCHRFLHAFESDHNWLQKSEWDSEREKKQAMHPKHKMTLLIANSLPGNRKMSATMPRKTDLQNSFKSQFLFTLSLFCQGENENCFLGHFPWTWVCNALSQLFLSPPSPPKPSTGMEWMQLHQFHCLRPPATSRPRAKLTRGWSQMPLQTCHLGWRTPFILSATFMPLTQTMTLLGCLTKGLQRGKELHQWNWIAPNHIFTK